MESLKPGERTGSHKEFNHSSGGAISTPARGDAFSGLRQDKPRTLERLINAISIITGHLSAVAILMAAIILTYEVLVRYILKIATIWEIETSVYLLIFATFVGSAYGLKEGAHIHIDLLIVHLTHRTRAWLDLVTMIFSMIFCAFVAYLGWHLWWEAVQEGWRSESLWGPPLSIPYFFLPMGMTLLTFQYCVQIAQHWSNMRSRSPLGKS